MIRRDVLIPAGGTIEAAFAERIGTPLRALAPIGPKSKPVLQIVVDALHESGCVERIVVVAGDAVRARVTGVTTWLPEGTSGTANILSGLAALPNAEAPAFICASDLPLATADAVKAFAEACDPGSDLTAGLIDADRYRAAFPDAPPSEFVTLRDAGPVTMSGLFGVRPSALLRNQARLTQAFEARKHQGRMACLLGPRLLWQWATQTLTLEAITTRVQTQLHCDAQILRANVAPELACDMDTADDYTYAHQIYTARLVS